MPAECYSDILYGGVCRAVLDGDLTCVSEARPLIIGIVTRGFRPRGGGLPGPAQRVIGAPAEGVADRALGMGQRPPAERRLLEKEIGKGD
jgi:hypothetical protein